MNIKTLSTTEFRKNISEMLSLIREEKGSLIIGRRNNPEAIIIPFPKNFNSNLSEISNINAYSESFSFLDKEPNFYSAKDIKKKYV